VSTCWSGKQHPSKVVQNIAWARSLIRILSGVFSITLRDPLPIWKIPTHIESAVSTDSGNMSFTTITMYAELSCVCSHDFFFLDWTRRSILNVFGSGFSIEPAFYDSGLESRSDKVAGQIMWYSRLPTRLSRNQIKKPQNRKTHTILESFFVGQWEELREEY